MTGEASQDLTQIRRQGDVVLEQVRGEVALLKQAVELGAKATEGNLGALGSQIGLLNSKLDQVISAQADPGASPGGRVILEKITALEKDRDDHETRIVAAEIFQTTITAALKTVRAQITIGGFILGLVSGMTAVYAAFVR